MKRAAAAVLLLLAACNRPAETPSPAASAPPPIGDATKGKALIAQYGCNVCHIIPGIDGPQGSLGPSLEAVASRPAISNGAVPNNPDNLAAYIANPPAMNPQTTMPALGLQGNDAKDIAAYLLALK